MSEPTPPAAARPKIVLVTTRALDGESMAGRLRIVHAIRSALSSWSDLTVVQLPNVLTDMAPGRLIGATYAWVANLLQGTLLPLQCGLFASSADHIRLIRSLPSDVTAVYLDGVRSYSLLVHLRKARPDLRIVVDLDDLMSRRMSLLLAAGQPLSPGYLTKRLPIALQKFTMSKWIGRWIVGYERATLQTIERRMADLADALVLLSSEDARKLKSLCEGDHRAEIAVIPPGSSPVSPPRKVGEPIRFVFIGSDALTQNRLTIEYLTDLWARRGFTAELVFFGLRSDDTPLPPNVRAAGYVEDLAEVYDGRSVLLTPSLIGGGVKTKVLEAFSRGAPVIGNPMTFESMPLEDYPLNTADEADLVRIISDPEAHRDLFDRAAVAGAEYLATHHAPDVFAATWRRMMAPDEAASGPKGADQP